MNCSNNTSNYDPRDSVIPKPVFLEKRGGVFRLTAETKILFDSDLPGAKNVGSYLAALLGSAAEFELRVSSGSPSAGNIHLGLANDETLGKEGYDLSIAQESVVLKANSAHGLFYGVQTLRQLLPVAGISRLIRAAKITDYPRFQWRGAMLDTARNFFSVQEIKHFIDLLSLYKINRLHLHLTDDQGWRIEIKKWPGLARLGGSSAVEGGRTGFFTQKDFREIASYAQSRFITIIPEVDVPGHTNAALSAYPELNEDGIAPEPFRGWKVGFSTLAVKKEITYRFLNDVFSELSALTNGPYLHVGGDEAHSTKPGEYAFFLERLQPIIAAQNKIMVGWGEIAQADLDKSAIVQIWRKEKGDLLQALKQGQKLIMSPSHHIYMDMKYTEETKLGQDWAGLIEVDRAYNWDPTTVYPGVKEKDVLGVEAPLWAENVRSVDDLEYMFFPRLPGLSEIGWSPRQGRNWEEYRTRLAAHGPLWEAMGINFYRSPQINWK